MAEEPRAGAKEEERDELAAALARRGIVATPEQFHELVIRAVDNIHDVKPVDPRQGLTPGESSSLEEGGFELEDEPTGKATPLAQTAAEFAALVASSLTVADVANRLGVQPSRVRQRAGDGSLYGFKLGRMWRFPLFQFDGSNEVPNISRVLQKISRDVHPVAVARWLSSPNSDLVISGTAVSPLEWLHAGHETSIVVRIAREL